MNLARRDSFSHDRSSLKTHGTTCMVINILFKYYRHNDTVICTIHVICTEDCTSKKKEKKEKSEKEATKTYVCS